MAPVFAYLRTRVYVAWLLAECCCILATIGAHQSSNDAGSIDFEAVRNIDMYECEFGRGFRSSMRGWNRSVQRWLAQHVYHRAPRGVG